MLIFHQQQEQIIQLQKELEVQKQRLHQQQFENRQLQLEIQQEDLDKLQKCKNLQHCDTSPGKNSDDSATDQQLVIDEGQPNNDFDGVVCSSQTSEKV